MKNQIGLFGFGYTAQAFAKAMVNRGFTIYATSRSRQVREALTNENIKVLDFTKESAEQIIASCPFIVQSIPPNEQEIDPVLSRFKPLLIDSAHRIQWIAYLSATSVYGDHQGEWVTEESESLNPGTTGILRLMAEKEWLYLYQHHKLPVHIFRLAGIYGPGRSSIERVLSNRTFSIYKPHQVFSRIHIEDIIQVLDLSLHQPTPGELFNVSDDLPAPSHEVEAFTLNEMNLPPLPLVHIDKINLSPAGLEFYRSNKRVSNTKIKTLLNFKPKYPTYKDGIKALVTAYQSSLKK
ncbi:SDR family oxidoreductase [Legionella impletisoli]|uniref:NAD(P)-dependent oxidoreductase n=1 Tax=Legionella impletisoli TaxID=343510 RepID=A0A917N9Z2_9GAMM|nr:SDR family oxidoreductase [Legionella impletisoli]GGI81876.1 NAD(P)-dependent oxidoreductase [Legionella impletisoli]